MRFKEWKYPEFDEKGMTKWNWICQYPENLKLGENTDIGAFTCINAKYGVKIQENVQIGSHCSIYSWSTIDDKKGKVTIKKNAKVGAHTIIMPGVTIGENAIVGACSFVTEDVPDNAVVGGGGGASKGDKEKVVILGAGGLAREVYWFFCDANKIGRDIEVLGFIDENPVNWGGKLCGIPILGDFRWFELANAKGKVKVICAAGSTKAKKSLVVKAERIGLSFCTIIHPTAQLSQYVEIGVGTVITAGCILTTQIRIGNHVYLNLDTTVGHDVTIEDFVNVAPGCHISGNVILKEGADLGTGAVVLQGINIGKWSTVGAGAVVIEDVPDNTVVVGVPAKVIK